MEYLAVNKLCYKETADADYCYMQFRVLAICTESRNGKIHKKINRLKNTILGRFVTPATSTQVGILPNEYLYTQ